MQLSTKNVIVSLSTVLNVVFMLEVVTKQQLVSIWPFQNFGFAVVMALGVVVRDCATEHRHRPWYHTNTCTELLVFWTLAPFFIAIAVIPKVG